MMRFESFYFLHFSVTSVANGLRFTQESVTWKTVQHRNSSPFKGEVERGMGFYTAAEPIPTLALPLKGREILDPILSPILPTAK